jgi:hypothetical protein
MGILTLAQHYARSASLGGFLYVGEVLVRTEHVARAIVYA